MRSMADFEKVHLEVRAGDTYGLEFPFSAEMLRDEALGLALADLRLPKVRAIATHNSVRLEEVVDFVGGGAASKAVLTVSYAKPDASLHTRLFAKMPHVVERKREKYLNAVVYKSDGPEVTFAQKFASVAPVRCAQTYFADRNEATTNYILITECLEYASADGTRAATTAAACRRCEFSARTTSSGTIIWAPSRRSTTLCSCVSWAASAAGTRKRRGGAQPERRCRPYPKTTAWRRRWRRCSSIPSRNL